MDMGPCFERGRDEGLHEKRGRAGMSTTALTEEQAPFLASPWSGPLSLRTGCPREDTHGPPLGPPSACGSQAHPSACCLRNVQPSPTKGAWVGQWERMQSEILQDWGLGKIPGAWWDMKGAKMGRGDLPTRGLLGAIVSTPLTYLPASLLPIC